MRLKVVRLHTKIADCRIKNMHQLSRELINDNYARRPYEYFVHPRWDLLRHSRLGTAVRDID